MSKIQILKAIHNTDITGVTDDQVVSDVKDTNFESYSQQTKAERDAMTSCFRCQRYKF